MICLLLFGAAMASAAPPKGQPPAADALKEAAGLLDQGRFREAAETFQRADELAGGSCGPCLLGLSRAQLGLHHPEKAADTARQAVDALHTSDLIGQAWNQVGMALTSRVKPDLAGAEEAFRKAVETGAGGQLASVSRYNLADVLWREKKYAESEQMALQALTSDPAGPAALNARIVLCQARTDGAPIAPPEVVYEDAACAKEGLRIFEKRVKAPPEGKQVSRPRKLFGRPPEYADGVTKHGTVVVEAVIDREGCIEKLRVCKSVHPKLDLATLDAVRRWVFRPAELDGQPVKVYYTLTVNFTR
ncbi:MAG: TonB family protein [Thermoanaerobaculia bacterium]